MERLTKRDEFGNADIIGVDSQELQCNLDFGEFNKVTNALNRLAEYEDLQEQNKLLILPCAVGDIVYVLWGVPKPDKYVIYQAEVKEIRIGKYCNRKNIKYRLEPISYRGRIYDFYSDDFEELFFLTKEQAESALKEMEDSNGN